MKAMVLAAGFGSRLGEITKNTPKCLVEVGGKPMLEHVVDRLRGCGVTEVVINLHYLAQQVRDFVVARNNFGISVQFSYEPEILETGGGLLAAWPFLSNERFFIVHNSDVYCDANLQELISAAERSNAIATLAVMSRQSSRNLLFDDNENLIGWESSKDGDTTTRSVAREVVNPTRYAFSGIHVVSNALHSYLRMSSGKFSIIESYLNAARAGQSVRAHRIDGAFWIDVGSPAQLKLLDAHLKSHA